MFTNLLVFALCTGEDEEAAPAAAGNVNEVDFETDGENEQEQTSDKTENTEEAAKPMEQDD